MAFDESKNNKIDRYVNKELEGEELRQFEAEMQSDKSLAEEVEFNSSMYELLSNSPENALRRNLQMLNETVVDENPDNQNKKNNGDGGSSFNKLIWLLIPVAALAGGWWLLSKPAVPEEIAAPTIVEIDDPTLVTIGEQSSSVQSTPAEEAEPVEEKIEQQVSIPDPPQQKTSKAKPKTIDRFAAEPGLDLLVQSVLGKMLQLRTRTRVGSFTNESTTTKVTLSLTGNFESQKDLSNQQLPFYLYSNSASDYKSRKTLFTGSISPQASSTANTYKIDFEKTMQLPEGLYYYLVEDPETKELMMAHKFEVERL